MPRDVSNLKPSPAVPLIRMKQAWQAQAGKAPQADFQQGTTAAPPRLPGRMRPETRLNGMESAVGRHGRTFCRRDFLGAGSCRQIEV